MVNQEILAGYCQQYLRVDKFDDYCPNGLQIQGKPDIKKIISGVSANQDLIDAAIDEKADALFVHHGFFWKNEASEIIGIKKNRIKALLDNDINLYAYHLPLDAHTTVGNNIQLAQRLNIKNPEPIGDTLVWQGEVETTLSKLSNTIEQALNRVPLVFGDDDKSLKRIAWCTGGAQSYIEHAININADCFITGEVSEQIPAIALENNIAFVSAGHHATERYGVQALCQHLSQKFNLKCQFIDINNQV
ncbi:GTP cyclohydrolase 1 type 2 homolog YbgI [uncultured Gammaproteobacteria bacterium]|jgi:dinuclear metal center YbgI/SA1388 family protein|uniref:Nif3-like dinuclear metal center hexameric protein n=1 Tax=thiotrophic endosymbiont of Bathymodiolus puteoserpentis (Logatchev) TaxID=343240 RepID=UPI0010B952EA|nr:Nif3-like dinuclear metal center hexameric protein [thiotrophic endosymbiont of Bathymodiolus puteoserpentis (Logatchev)]CAC9496920.1 GTP cyclohydrolase 1 type 2 homolog YbgI [uncultured Gammaproteobacteria bacterium]CAC9604639.1 GTP cyclohydrolase 1 type 2 homolog YbgI [uncultured Gammaproteobacteria bacterium]CAC9656494.1 GTP cyclohydrolase 1 type 2 homolog YbgI [uncultured Gammaproteobacteria bacterium]CAC9979723.1 GTP cyclohydrolase 1 type 2 homolog YbgI [uncultured Gammaproteobacteria b